MKVYISGPISGLPFEEVEKNFNSMENSIQDMGHTAVNPLNNGLPRDASWDDHMKADIKLMMECDTIYLLENWRQSRGALIEFDLAVKLNFRILSV